MALGPNYGRRANRHTVPVLDHSAERPSTRVAINAENSALVERFRRDRANVRPYVRTSTQKLKWTHELHQCFMRAVEKLGGQNKATPKRILQHMNRDGITIAHIKSHLQACERTKFFLKRFSRAHVVFSQADSEMFRSGKINAEGLPKSEYTTWQGGEWQSNNAGQQAGPVNSSSPAQPESKFEELSGNLELEPALALIQLQEDSRRSSDSGAAASESWRGSPDEQDNFESYVHKKSKALKRQLQEDGATGNRGFVVELNDKCIQNSPNREQELHQQDLGQSSTIRPDPWPSPSSNSFLCEASSSHPVDVTDSLSARSKRKAEEVIELNLTMATRSLRPGFQFASPPTAEEANLNLALS